MAHLEQWNVAITQTSRRYIQSTPPECQINKQHILQRVTAGVQHVPVSNEANEALKARLADLAHCGIPNNLSDFHMQRHCLVTILELKSNREIQDCRPDKGSGVDIL